MPLKLQELKERYGPRGEGGRVTHLDGVSVDFDDWHFNVRPSNTEPLLRLNLEAYTAAEMERRRDEVLGADPLVSAGPTTARPPYRFSAKLRVGFDETDAQAVVYYGRYFPYFDRARVEYQRHLGLLHSLPPGLRVRDAARLVRVRGARALRRRDRGLHPHRVDRPHLVALGDGRARVRVRRRCSPTPSRSWC